MTKNMKIAKCILELCGTEVGLDSKNAGGGNYKYASLPHLQRIVMPVVKAHGLMLFQSVTSWDVEFRTIKVQKNAQTPPFDKQFCLAKCELKTTLCDPETGDSVYTVVYGSKADQSSGDKSLGAVTTAKRYGIAAMFNLILSDDDGGDTDATANGPFELMNKPAPAANIVPEPLLGLPGTPAKTKAPDMFDQLLGIKA